MHLSPIRSWHLIPPGGQKCVADTSPEVFLPSESQAWKEGTGWASAPPLFPHSWLPPLLPPHRVLPQNDLLWATWKGQWRAELSRGLCLKCRPHSCPLREAGEGLGDHLKPTLVLSPVAVIKHSDKINSGGKGLFGSQFLVTVMVHHCGRQ